jgi:hypothetical protein
MQMPLGAYDWNITRHTQHIDALGRSGQEFQICYRLQHVAPIKDLCEDAIAEVTTEWRVRSAAFHHQFDVLSGNALWIVTQLGLSIKDLVKETTLPRDKPEHRQSESWEDRFGATLSMHVSFCNWSLDGWREYVQWLKRELEEVTHNRVWVHGVRKPIDIQTLHYWEDRMKDAIMTLGNNVDVLTRLRDFYKSLVNQQDFDPGDTVRESFDNFTVQMNDTINSTRAHITDLKLIVGSRSDNTNAVRPNFSFFWVPTVEFTQSVDACRCSWSA